MKYLCVIMMFLLMYFLASCTSNNNYVTPDRNSKKGLPVNQGDLTMVMIAMSLMILIIL